MVKSDRSSVAHVPQLVQDIYRVVAELERLFPGRRFTPDGHMVGSIGEVLAEYVYDLELLPASAETHDAKAPNGALVQIKATQGRRVALSSKPRHLLVLKLNKKGLVEEIYNGPGPLAWKAAGKMQKNGQCPISLARLAALMKQVSPDRRIPRFRELGQESKRE